MRLRCYCSEDNNTLAFPEIKKKLNGFVSKRRTNITYEEAKILINHKILPDIKPYHNPQVMNEDYTLNIGSNFYDFSLSNLITSIGDGGTTMGNPGMGGPGRPG